MYERLYLELFNFNIRSLDFPSILGEFNLAVYSNMARKKLTKKYIDEIKRLRSEEKFSQTVIADMFNLERTTVLYHCRTLPREYPLIDHKQFIKNENYFRNKCRVKLPKKRTPETRSYHFISTPKYDPYEEAIIKQINRKKFLTDNLRKRAIDVALKTIGRLKYHQADYSPKDFQML